MRIAQGAHVGNVAVSNSSKGNAEKIEEVRFEKSDTGSDMLYMWINNSLSYISIAEAVAIRDEINQALKETLKLI